ncbi:XdhC family protein [Wansuia hejianensis]|uniref:XdhC family protein n=1 Tax=Wansuia hejianensis TaxID=2763667 RepID=A0A926IH13_9FIRM|nr:XdhC/CoxI family protein [Wansuia hejianensis]MBC8590157.1 XdhC family protein [Wansuia hejianensis]
MSEIIIMKSLLELIEKGEDLALITITKAQGSTPRGIGAQMIVLGDGSIIGTVGGGILEKRIIQLGVEAIEKGNSQSIPLDLKAEDIGMVCGGQIEIFIQIYKSRPKLLIVGGGHVSFALYNLASILDFDIVIFEDREEFLNPERFPLAKELVLGPIDKSLREHGISEDSYIVIVTRGHKYDEEALEAVIDSKAKYIGVMGSKKKVLNMFDNIKSRGISEESLSKVYSPIGLDIGNSSPEEIGISILAEILAVKNNRKVQHMRIER